MRQHRYYLLFLIGLLALTGCTSDNLVNEAIDDLEQSAQPGIAGEATQLINAARSESRYCGNERFEATSPVDWNDQLANAAYLHSRDMARNNLFSHTGSDGTNAGARIDKTGYQARTWGENIAAGYPSLGSVIEGWIESPGHCSNIMNPNFTEIGLASAEQSGNAYGIYWTLVLAAAR